MKRLFAVRFYDSRLGIFILDALRFATKEQAENHASTFGADNKATVREVE